jgi:hypothetical protein
MKSINIKVYATIQSDDVMCQFMVITLIDVVRNVFIGNVGRRSIVGVVKAAGTATRSRLYTFRSVYI